MIGATPADRDRGGGNPGADHVMAGSVPVKAPARLFSELKARCPRRESKPRGDVCGNSYSVRILS
jgi:hypothetical protein